MVFKRGATQPDDWREDGVEVSQQVDEAKKVSDGIYAKVADEDFEVLQCRDDLVLDGLLDQAAPARPFEAMFG